MKLKYRQLILQNNLFLVIKYSVLNICSCRLDSFDSVEWKVNLINLSNTKIENLVSCGSVNLARNLSFNTPSPYPGSIDPSHSCATVVTGTCKFGTGLYCPMFSMQLQINWVFWPQGKVVFYPPLHFLDLHVTIDQL